MYVKRYGQGARSFLALHGWAGNHRTFERVGDYVPEDASLYSADLPGYGQTPAPSEWTLDALIGPVAQALDDRKLSEVTLVGYCGGALLALEMTRRRPERIARIVAIDPFAYLPLYLKVFVKPSWGRRAYEGTFANPVGRWITNALAGMSGKAGPNPTAAFERVNHEAAYNHLALIAQLVPFNDANAIAVPVDIVHGEHTFTAVRKSASIWCELLAQVRVFALPGAGHEPTREAPRQLADVIFAPDSAEGLVYPHASPQRTHGAC